MDQQPRGMGAQLTVAQQIGLIVGVAVFALVLILVLSLVRVQTLGNTVDRLATEQVERLQLALRWRSNIAVNSTRVFSIVQTEGDDLQNYFKDVVAATTADTSKVQKRYTELENSPQGLLIQEELATIRKSYLETRDKSLALKKAGDMAQARAYALGSFAPVLDKYNAVADKMVNDDKELVQALVDSPNFSFNACRLAFKFLYGRAENVCESKVFDACVTEFKSKGTIQAALASVAKDPGFCQ